MKGSISFKDDLFIEDTTSAAAARTTMAVSVPAVLCRSRNFQWAEPYTVPCIERPHQSRITIQTQSTQGHFPLFFAVKLFVVCGSGRYRVHRFGHLASNRRQRQQTCLHTFTDTFDHVLSCDQFISLVQGKQRRAIDKNVQSSANQNNTIQPS